MSGPNFNLYYVRDLDLAVFAPIQLSRALTDPSHPYFQAQPRRGGPTEVERGTYNLCGRELMPTVRNLAEDHEREHVRAFVTSLESQLAGWAADELEAMAGSSAPLVTPVDDLIDLLWRDADIASNAIHSTRRNPFLLIPTNRHGECGFRTVDGRILTH